MLMTPHFAAFARLASQGGVGQDNLAVSRGLVIIQDRKIPGASNAGPGEPVHKGPGVSSEIEAVDDPQEELKAYVQAAFEVIRDTGEWIDYLILRGPGLKKFGANFGNAEGNVFYIDDIHFSKTETNVGAQYEVIPKQEDKAQ